MPKEQRDLITRIKPFARLQTALDHEKLQDGLLCEYKLHHNAHYSLILVPQTRLRSGSG